MKGEEKKSANIKTKACPHPFLSPPKGFQFLNLIFNFIYRIILFFSNSLKSEITEIASPGVSISQWLFQTTYPPLLLGCCC